MHILATQTYILFKNLQIKIMPAKYIMKTDDDAFVRIDEVISSLKKSDPHGLLYGLISFQSSPHRDKDSKWFISPKVLDLSNYPHEDIIHLGCLFLPLRNTGMACWNVSTVGSWSRLHNFKGHCKICRSRSSRTNTSGWKMNSPYAHKLILYYPVTHWSWLIFILPKLFKLEDVAMGIWIQQYKNSGQEVNYANDERFYNEGCDTDYVLAHYQSPRLMMCLWEKLQKESQPVCCE